MTLLSNFQLPTLSIMQFKSILLALLFSTQGLASPMPEGTENSLVARSCYGAKAGCNTMPSGACDDAADKLVDDKEYHTQCATPSTFETIL